MVVSVGDVCSARAALRWQLGLSVRKEKRGGGTAAMCFGVWRWLALVTLAALGNGETEEQRLGREF